MLHIPFLQDTVPMEKVPKNKDKPSHCDPKRQNTSSGIGWLFHVNLWKPIMASKDILPSLNG